MEILSVILGLIALYFASATYADVTYQYSIQGHWLEILMIGAVVTSLLTWGAWALWPNT